MYKTEKELKKELKAKLLILLALLVVLLAAGTLFYHIKEGWSYSDALFFSAISLTSRGFSDLRPHGPLSVLVSVLYLFIGVTLIVFTISSLVSYYNSFYEARFTKAVKRMNPGLKACTERWVMLKMKDSKTNKGARESPAAAH